MLWDHGYGPSASHGLPVFAPAVTGTCAYPQWDGQAEFTWLYRVATKHEKNSLSSPGFNRAIITLFQRLSQQKVYLIMTFINQGWWLTRACRSVLLKSTVFVHQLHLAAYGLHDTGCTQSAVSFPWGCTEFPVNSMGFPCSEKSLSILGFPGLWATQLYTEMACPQKTIATHPSNNQAWYRVALLIKTTVLPLRQTATFLS